MMIQLTPLTISGILILTFLSPISYILLKQGKTHLTRIFNFHLLTLLVWGIGCILIGSNKNPNLSLYIQDFAGTGVIFMPSTLFHSISLLGKKKNKLLTLLFYGQSIIFTYFLLTHQMFTYPKHMFDSLYIPQGHILYLYCYIFWMSIVLFSICQLMSYYKNSRPTNKIEILTLLISLPVVFGLGSLNFIPHFGISIYPYYPYCNFFIPIYGLVLAFLILKYDFLNIGLVIRRGVGYSILATFLTILYFITIFLSERIFQNFIGYKGMAISSIAALVIMIVFMPLKNMIQNLLDKIFIKGTPIQIAEENVYLRKEVAQTEKFRIAAALASGIAHEIRNPLTSLKTFCEKLKEKKNDPDFIKSFEYITNNEIKRIDDLTRQLMDFAKPQTPLLAPTNINSLIDEMLSLVSNQLGKNNIKLVKSYQRSDVTINIDKNQIKQALLNIILNAIDAMPQGGTLTISLSTASSIIQISIKDTGSGISAEDLAHIFEPFFTTKKDTGTGLGLAITETIIKNHNGKLSVKSKINLGTEFFIELSYNT